MADVIPFPLARRVDYVRRHAERALELDAETGERHLSRQIDVQRQALLRKGCDPAAVERQCQALDAAMRAQMWRAVMSPSGYVS